MQAIHITDFSAPLSSISPQTIPIPPPPSPNEALIRIHCAALNHVDLLYAQGKHQNNTSLIRPPFTLGLEFSGTIIALGEPAPTTPLARTSNHDTADEHPLQIGDKVFGAGPGAFAERIVVPVGSLHRIPPGWAFKDAAGLAATASVAYGAVVMRGDVGDGQWVLIHGAAGGVGVYACQIAKACGARVIAGVRSLGDSEKVRMLRGLGCVDAIVETGGKGDGGESWMSNVRKITEGKGVDVVIDNVGLVKESLRCLRPVAGKIVLVGFAGREGVMEQLSVNRILLRQAVVIGYRYGETNRRNPNETKLIWDGLMNLIKSNAVKPVTFEKRYRGLSEVRNAMSDLQARKIYGKAVIYVDENESGRAAL
ncbi:alcohol dehydrogenase [Blastomyces dermatitidis ER-3]|uniref:Alcohol dehydrogenase n=1 Tax=Ajellomyces dermatitidis (strain ER-3 / ATCC MYA-2586) TaxID=559297 RepID=A0ABP2EMY7_AJEDR|nr:alcohol dehydrogenase [Blastomyces dermatitidis ER-3]EEQ84432.2 alcohol dehydrogenase [Blastomyces dermatitidis ER-3]